MYYFTTGITHAFRNVLQVRYAEWNNLEYWAKRISLILIRGLVFQLGMYAIICQKLSLPMTRKQGYLLSSYTLESNHRTLFTALILATIFRYIFGSHLHQENAINFKWQFYFVVVTILFYIFLLLECRTYFS